jgi:hyperosmotically inducible periplasmic protein
MIRIICRMLVTAMFLCSFGLLWGQQDPASQSAPDNTKMNQGDRSASATTADQQKDNTADRHMTQQIRRALVKDKALSTYGHNIKIITQQGIVTLKGPVKSAEEKQEIESKAAEVAGSPDKIHSELQIAGDTGTKPSANPDEK